MLSVGVRVVFCMGVPLVPMPQEHCVFFMQLGWSVGTQNASRSDQSDLVTPRIVFDN